MLAIGGIIPNLALQKPDGTLFHCWDLWEKKHGLLVLSLENSGLEALRKAFAAKGEIFNWLNVELIPATQAAQGGGWTPVSGLPADLEWGKAYLFSRYRGVFEVYEEAEGLSLEKLEKDVTYWEARHC